MHTDVLQAGINLSSIMMDYCAKYTGISDILQTYSEQITNRTGVFEKEKIALDNLSETGDRINKNIANIIENYSENARSVDIISESFSDVGQKVIEIETATKLFSETLKLLSDQMEIITEYTHTIKEISKQTNLLSINASIEAARAGTAGNGFRIIAGEVKKLSETTESTAQEIAKIVKTFTDHINGLETKQRAYNQILKNLITMTNDSKNKLTELKNNEEVNSKETEHILALLKENTLNIENAVEAIKDNEKQNAEHIQSFADKASETTLLFNDLISFIIELSEIFKHLQAE